MCQAKYISSAINNKINLVLLLFWGRMFAKISYCFPLFFLGLRTFSNVNVIHKGLLLQDWILNKFSICTFLGQNRLKFFLNMPIFNGGFYLKKYARYFQQSNESVFVSST